MNERKYPLYRITIERLESPTVDAGHHHPDQRVEVVCADTGKAPLQTAWVTPYCPRMSVDVRSGAFVVGVGVLPKYG